MLILVPEACSDEKLPGVVLVHGGGGTAYSEWVKIWNERGYAAIAVDLEGHVPVPKAGGPSEGRHWESHAWSGPVRVGFFDDITEPLENQWMYHAVSSVMLAHSLLRSIEEVDNEKIGITGISWGGIITSLVSGVENRFAFAVPVYGCGYLYESKSVFGTYFANENKKIWDPSNFIHQAKIPLLWVNSDHDGHFSVDITSKSYKMTKQNFLLLSQWLHHIMRASKARLTFFSAPL
ncbi:MAG: hypothetical protein A2Y21_03870 [Clostridiales bacterium GWC2_40_7]|nr:MAG: hypothetical protein A2Y21_03870 [Clostridiales bacterium GWC2_40_7]